MSLMNMSKRISLIIIIALGLILRLLAWRWHEFYALGGDEREYLEQAITLVRDHQYGELRLMRPPLYPLFLAGCIYLVDSLVQNLRLVQALISAATVPLVYLLTREVTWRSDRRTPALLAALLCALSYTLAANASELLTEALFLFGLTTALWLLLRAARTEGLPETILAGLIIGALCLLRSVALPLLPLGALWLLVRRWAHRDAPLRHGWGLAVVYVLATLLIVLPWTVRNYTTYGGLILIDTTGAENLWLDNDPAGRESVKAQLYALGDDRLARQRLATQQGLAVISADPARFAAKAWGELKKLFALEFSDDLLARPAIWVSQPEVAARLLLGDGIWLLMLLAGGVGLARGSGVGGRGSGVANTERGDENTNQHDTSLSRVTCPLPPAPCPLPPAPWLLLPWALYVALTTLIFHVELRYRLPLYPALLPYAGLVLAGVGSGVRGQGSGVRGQGSGVRGRVLAAIVPDSHAIRAQHPMKRAAGVRLSAIGYRLSAIVPVVCITLTLLHMNYPALAWRLGWKHWDLGRAEAALNQHDPATARQAALAALARDDSSALARVALARTDLLAGDQVAAASQLDAAVRALPAHPYAHLLRGDLLRRQGHLDSARADLAYETSSREDLQSWAWTRFASDPPTGLALGDGLDLGFIRGFHSLRAGEGGFRWTTGDAEVRLTLPPGATTVRLHAASGRPDGSATELSVTLDGRDAGTILISADSGVYVLALPVRPPNTHVVVGLRSSTFTPRDYDKASPDGRTLGVKLEEVEIVTALVSCAKETNVLY